MIIWLVNLPQDEASRAAYVSTVKRTMAMTLPTAVAREVLQQLASRATSTPELSHFAVEVSWAWLLRDAQSVSVDALLAAWRGCFALLFHAAWTSRLLFFLHLGFFWDFLYFSRFQGGAFMSGPLPPAQTVAALPPIQQRFRVPINQMFPNDTGINGVQKKMVVSKGL